MSISRSVAQLLNYAYVVVEIVLFSSHTRTLWRRVALRKHTAVASVLARASRERGVAYGVWRGCKPWRRDVGHRLGKALSALSEANDCNSTTTEAFTSVVSFITLWYYRYYCYDGRERAAAKLKAKLASFLETAATPHCLFP